MLKLSIITCTYNSEKYLQKCLDGIISQGLMSSEYEHIFIDAFSTDKTLDIIGKYKKNNIDHTINIIQQKPQGIYHAMNEGIKQASGEYLMFCNSDDFLEKNILENYINYINKTHKKDIYYARFNRESGGRIIGTIPSSNRIVFFLQKIFFYIGLNTLVYHPTTIIKKSLFDKLGYYDETKKIASDYGFWLNCIKYKKTFVYFPYVVNNFRVNEGSITSNPANKQIEMNENYYFRKKYLGWWGVIIHQISKLYVYFSSMSNKG